MELVAVRRLKTSSAFAYPKSAELVMGLRRNQHLPLAQFFFMKVVLCLDVVIGLHVDPVPLRPLKGPGEP